MTETPEIEPNTEQRVVIDLPIGFTPDKGPTIIAKITADKGPGWEIDHINMAENKMILVRSRTIVGITRNKDSVDIELTRDVRESDGKKYDAKYHDSEEYPGYYMTDFQPFSKRATLSRLTEEEFRCREAVALVLGSPPWEVKIKARPDGGFAVKLTSRYMPSKHDSKLEEVASEVVGKEGWYVTTNPAKRTAQIIPSEPSTFPRAIAYPFKQPVNQFTPGSKDWAKLPIGMNLPDAGKKVGTPFMLDLSKAPHTQLSGTSGSGKAEALGNLIPTPDGWKTVADLRPGDTVIAADGHPTTLVGMSATVDEELFDVVFTDGQRVRVTAGHLWRVEGLRVGTGLPVGHGINPAATRALVETLKPGAYGSLASIAGTAGISLDMLGCVAARHAIGRDWMRETPVTETTDTLFFDRAQAASVLAAAGEGNPLGDNEIRGNYSDVRALAFEVGYGNSPAALTRLSRVLMEAGVEHRLGESVASVAEMENDDAESTELFPARELLTLAADMAEGQSYRIMTTEELSSVLPSREVSVALSPILGGTSDESLLSWLETFETGSFPVGTQLPPALMRAPWGNRNTVFEELVRLYGVESSEDINQVMLHTGAYENGDTLAASIAELARTLGLSAINEGDAVVVSLDAKNTGIVAVEPAGTGQARCLRVEHPSGMYLSGAFIPTHNSVTINALIAGALSRKVELVIIDLPHKAVDFMWCKPWVRPGGWGCDSLSSAVTAIRLVYEEGGRRAGVLKEHGALNWMELPASVYMPPIFVVVDELTGLFIPEKVPAGLPKDSEIVLEAQEINLQKAMLESNIKKTAAEMRFVGIHLLLASQVSSTTTGVDTSLRMNLANKILLGSNPTDNNRKLSLTDASRVPKVPGNVQSDSSASMGVGVAELEATEPTVFKTCYASTEDYKAWLAPLNLPLQDDPAPTAAQIARLTPTLDDGGRGSAVKSVPRARQETPDWAVGDDGKPLTGFEKANATRAEAKRQEMANEAAKVAAAQ